MKTTLQMMNIRAGIYGLHISSHNPGGGSRYRIQRIQADGTKLDYFDGMYLATYTRLKEVGTFLDGYREALDAARPA